MSTRMTQNVDGHRRLGGALGGGLAALVVSLLALGAGSADARGWRPAFCSSTAHTQHRACLSEGSDDFYTARAICTNVSDAGERWECLLDAWSEHWEAWRLCFEQRTARKDLCGLLGEDRYDPEIDPADFEADPSEPANPNRWLPLRVGHQWTYEGGDETINVRVTEQTKQIQGVTCLVVRDTVDEDGDLIEDTVDWFGLRTDGTVDYFGEIAQNFEIIEGEGAELVDLEGSWKGGRDGAKSGTLFPGAPFVGQTYRQEWAAGNAEDAATVLSIDYRFGKEPRLDEYVPRELAELLCADGDCVVTRDFTPIDPEVFERKYYAPGIGVFLEVDPDSGDIVQLVDCSFDKRCDELPEL